MFIAPRMTSHEKSRAAQRSRSNMPSAHALRQIALTVRVSAMSALILSPAALAARYVATWGAETCAKGPAAALALPARVAESIAGGTGRSSHETVEAVRDEEGVQGANASACGTTSGITGTASAPLERACGRETGRRGMCAQCAASTMWCVGTQKTASETGRPEDGLDCTARMCVGGGVPCVGCDVERRRETGTRELGWYLGRVDGRHEPADFGQELMIRDGMNG
jgi:hypothetical protein